MAGTLAAALDELAPGRVVLVPGGAGEPTALLDALEADPARAEGVTFVSCAIPGVNRRDVAARLPGASTEGFFVPDSVRGQFETGRFRHVPLDYSAIPAYLAARVDLAFATVAPPQDGLVSLGIAQDVIPALLDGPARLVGLVNPAMPPARDGIRVPIERFAHLVAVGDPLVTIDTPVSTPVADAIGRAVATLVEDGATIEVGIGRLGAAVLASLRDRRDLGVHAGLISDGVLDLVDAGVIARGVTTGIAVGTGAFERRVAGHAAVRFRPIAVTHDAAGLAALPRFTAINFALEVDLFGQVNAERLGSRLAGGRGGLGDFSRGARRSKGGGAIVALASTAGRAGVSRIVPALSPGPVSLAHGEVDFVVTEHGVADLRQVSREVGAERLIAVADPDARNGLAEAWAAMRRAM